MRPDGNTLYPLRVIVSGGIGSGKSTVLRLFEQSGATVIEADQIGHDVLEPGEACFEDVGGRWPSVVVGGRIDRARLATIAFSDAEQLAELESMTHPAIRESIAALVAASIDEDIVLELPLHSDLVGEGWTRIVVDTPDDIRLQRSIDRGMSPEDVNRRMSRQPDRTVWLGDADIVVDNSGTIEDLERQAMRLWEKLHHCA